MNRSLALIGAMRPLAGTWVPSGCRSARRAAVEVPSLIVPVDTNVPLNPRRAAFSQIRFSEVTPFRFDPRLLKLGPEPM